VSAPSPGDPAKGRVAIIAWESAEKAQAYRDSAAFKELLPIRDKLAKFRGFTVEVYHSRPAVYLRPSSVSDNAFDSITRLMKISILIQENSEEIKTKITSSPELRE
jgi:hypothetical protein